MMIRFLAAILVCSVLAAGCVTVPRPSGHPSAAGTGTDQDARAAFLPPPLNDAWSRWLVGEWRGAGTSNAGKGNGTMRFELALSGQFLICRGGAEITELDPEYLKKQMHATDEEIERFKRSGYQSLEVYTIDPKTGEVVGSLFDNLRCRATGRGRREGNRETIHWQWHTGHQSTRITERVSADRMRIVERTVNTDGSVMEDAGEMVRSVPNQR